MRQNIEWSMRVLRSFNDCGSSYCKFGHVDCSEAETWKNTPELTLITRIFLCAMSCCQLCLPLPFFPADLGVGQGFQKQKNSNYEVAGLEIVTTTSSTVSAHTRICFMISMDRLLYLGRKGMLENSYQTRFFSFAFSC